MPIDKDIKKVLIIGSGPIQIGQAAEFDYSGSQACKSLREEGIETVLVNSNPATIQTDMDMADTVYTEPLTPEIVSEIIKKEKVDAILPTMGGQTGLNIATGLGDLGLLEGIKVLGSDIQTIKDVEDRDLFGHFMDKLNEPIPKCHAVESVEEAIEAVKDIGYPVIVRPAFTLGGTGGGVAYNEEELIEIATHGLDMSFINQVLIDESVLGWKEFEYEVMRDKEDTCIIVCNMENIDPMGIHTGESVVVAPAQNLNDKDSQALRDASIKIIRALGIQGGCNIQFAVNPETGECTKLLTDSKLNNRQIIDMHLDKHNNLWFSYYLGLVKYNIATHKRDEYFVPNTSEKVIGSNLINVLFEDKKGNIWAGSSGDGIFLYQPETNTFKSFNSQNSDLINDYILDINESLSGYLLIASNQGFSRFDMENERFYNYNKQNGFPMTALNPYGLFVAHDNEIFLSGPKMMISFFEKELNSYVKPYQLNFTSLEVNNKLILPNDGSGILSESILYQPQITLNHNHSIITVNFSLSNYVSVLRNRIYYKLEGFDKEWMSAGYRKGITYTNRQGFYVSCIEEIAWRQGWIPTEQLLLLGQQLEKTEYGKYLIELAKQS